MSEAQQTSIQVPTRAVSEGGRPEEVEARQSHWASIRDAIGAFFGAVLGLAPHVLHHVGLLAGAALITGATGNALFFLVGLVFSIPMLRRLYRRFHTWRAPAIAVSIFAAAFSLSAFVIGPTITGSSSSGSDPQPSQTPTQNHSSHHS